MSDTTNECWGYACLARPSGPTFYEVCKSVYGRKNLRTSGNDKPLLSKHLNRVAETEYGKFVRCLRTLCPDNSYMSRSGVDHEDLAQMAILRLYESLREKKIWAIPVQDRQIFVRRCLYRTAQQRYATLCRLERRRSQLEDSIDQEEFAPDFWKTFEELEAIATLTPHERAVLVNAGLTYTELHNRLYPEVSYPTFRKRLKAVQAEIEKKLTPT